MTICVYHKIQTPERPVRNNLRCTFFGVVLIKIQLTQENSSDNLNALKNTKSPKKIKNTHTSATLFGGYRKRGEGRVKGKSMFSFHLPTKYDLYNFTKKLNMKGNFSKR